MDDEFFVILDGEEVAFDEIKNENSRKIIIKFTEDSKKLEILGSNSLAGQNVSCKIIHNPPYSYLLPPLKQMENGITPTDVICKEELSKM